MNRCNTLWFLTFLRVWRRTLILSSLSMVNVMLQCKIYEHKYATYHTKYKQQKQESLLRLTFIAWDNECNFRMADSIRKTFLIFTWRKFIRIRSLHRMTHTHAHPTGQGKHKFFCPSRLYFFDCIVGKCAITISIHWPQCCSLGLSPYLHNSNDIWPFCGICRHCRLHIVAMFMVKVKCTQSQTSPLHMTDENPSNFFYNLIYRMDVIQN